jgi:transposase InsO family protein
MGQPGKVDEMPLQPQIVLEPFEKWAIDFVGPFNPPSHQKAYILVCTDYVTKWVEARAVTRATEQVVADFLFEEIFARYGTPREIVSDGGSQFTSHMIGKKMQKYGVKHRVTTPYHPQANGQVESTNKVLENILTKTVASHRGTGHRNFQKLYGHTEQHGETQLGFLHLN